MALALKGLDWREKMIDLFAGEQFGGTIAKLNPQNAVPVLIDGTNGFTQSLAILEYLDEKFPDPPLLPEDLLLRARVRSFALITIADTHPLTVPRTRTYLANTLGVSNDEIQEWARNWLMLGLRAMETRLAERQDEPEFCYGDLPGLADIGLMSHVAGAMLNGCSLESAPRVAGLYDRCQSVDAFTKTSPQTLRDSNPSE